MSCEVLKIPLCRGCRFHINRCWIEYYYKYLANQIPCKKDYIKNMITTFLNMSEMHYQEEYLFYFGKTISEYFPEYTNYFNTILLLK
jgi:hypothetical protein